MNIILYIFYIFLFLTLLSVFFLLYFSRDPDRNVIINDKVILSPADGKIIEITDENGYKVIKIFMSVLNVHVQRSPVKGTIQSVEHKPGKFLHAADKRASFENEQNVIVIQPDNVKLGKQIIVKQIAGLLARRTISFVKQGQQLNQGQRIGKIKLGSQVDLYYPNQPNVSLHIIPGENVKAGVTVLASLNNQ
jgi:phosphatidylserine decarboxylase